jgi:trans-aconitate methyltransferase
LDIGQSTVYDRLLRLNIPSQPSKKLHYKNKQHYVKIPKHYSNSLAEFVGIMLGDGHISHFQAIVTLGNKEGDYVKYVSELVNRVFKTQSRVTIKNGIYKTVYVGSTELVNWLKKMGLVHNKVNSQVDIPN